jgi:hypothetical protein
MLRWLFSIGVLFSLPALAAPQITSLNPDKGLAAGGTRVIISGTELIPQSLSCTAACTAANYCPLVDVDFGESRAHVLSATPTQIVVQTLGGTTGLVPQTVDVKISANHQVTATRPNGFTFDPYANDWDGYVQFLVPLLARDVKGANGSIWTTELSAHNRATYDPIRLYGRWCSDLLPTICDPLNTIEPEQTERLQLYPRTGGGDGAFLWIPKFAGSEIIKQLRVRDVSREDHGWGTEVPIVNVNERYDSSQTLIDIPTDPRYRVMLRVYGRDERPWSIDVTIYPASGGEAIDSFSTYLIGIDTANSVQLPLNPGYVALDPITEAVRASGHERVRIVVGASIGWDPPPPTDVWAFVSLTNNETQQVTVITPQE